LKKIKVSYQFHNIDQDKNSRANRKYLLNPWFNFCLEFTEGFKCGCDRWCKKQRSSYGVCGDGPTCICTQNPITKDNVGKKTEISENQTIKKCSFSSIFR
jgi:hypothetical protein